MDAQKQTVLFLVCWLASLAFFDLYILLRYCPEQTVSARLLDWAHRWPLFPYAFVFALGVLCGHLFLPMKR